MIHALRKTRSRAGAFLGDALAWRGADRQYALVAWSMVVGAVWLAFLLPSDADRVGSLVAGLSLLTILIVVCAIDARYGIIPDQLVVFLATGGLLQLYFVTKADILPRLCEALVLFVAAYLFQACYRWWRGYDGFGFGDVKFATAAVLWVGIEQMPTLILIAVLSAGGSLTILKKDGHQLDGKQAIAFGPHLAAALWLVWISRDRM